MLTTCTLSSWDTIQDVFYRKDEIYTLEWKISDLSDYIVTSARNGGPIGEPFVNLFVIFADH